ncbi:MAG: hypothetical protein HZA22_09330 [Nitrospirae bacterium]|nr:hypothetical protein [Nitrospirota bacterium]MBI5696779.1 hypothetical protein [Nitrospirota bacterium]
MLKRLLCTALCLTMAAAFMAGCGDKEAEKKKALEEAKQFALSTFEEGNAAPPKPKPLPKNLVINVPDSVKAKYTAVVMGVGNVKTKEIKKFTVKLGETAAVPGTDYTIKVISYLPHWTMRGGAVTSAADDQGDPAVRATIFEKDKQVFDGFIFKRHKTPSFINDNWAIGLLDSVPEK